MTFTDFLRSVFTNPEYAEKQRRLRSQGRMASAMPTVQERVLASDQSALGPYADSCDRGAQGEHPCGRLHDARRR